MYQRYPTFALIVTALFVLSNLLRASQSSGRRGDPAVQTTATGRVVDPQDMPVEGAKVTAYQLLYAEESSPKIEIVQQENTGGDGTFSLTIAQQGDRYRVAYVVARKEGFALGWAAWRTRMAQGFDIVLGKPKDLGGNVVDEKGQPVADAEVGIAVAVVGKGEDQRTLTLPSFLDTKTDKNGRFLFADLPADATFELLARKPGRVTLNTLAQAIVSDSSPTSTIPQIANRETGFQFSPGQTGIKLVLPLEARVEGMVVEKTSGKAIGGVKVSARAGQSQGGGFVPPEPAATADDGTFHMSGLGAGNWSVQIAPTRRGVAEWVAEPVQVSLKAGEMNSGVKLQLTRGGIMEVLVKDADGKPITEVTVMVRHMQHAQYFSGSTDENGLARIRVTSGQYRVSGLHKIGAAPPLEEEQVTIEEGETKRVECVLNVAPRVTGTVRDTTGRPLAGVRIAVIPMGPLEVETNANGEFSVSWYTGVPGFKVATSVLVARDVGRNQAEIVEVDEQTKRLNLTVNPAAILTGTVLNQEGKPLSGATILVMLRLSDETAPLGRIAQATTGEDGTFEVKAVPAEQQYVVSATATGYGTHRVSANVSNLKDNRYEVGQLKLPLADLSVSGIVVDSTNKPIAGARVSVVGAASHIGSEIRSDSDGKFVIKGVSSGPVLLMAYTGGSKRMHGSVEANAGATDVRIVISEK